MTILHTSLRWQQQNLNQTSSSRVSYGVSIMRILKKIDRVITVTDCSLLLDDTEPLPKPMLSYHRKCSVFLAWEQLHNGVFFEWA